MLKHLTPMKAIVRGLLALSPDALYLGRSLKPASERTESV